MFLVTGASGKLGRGVIDSLLADHGIAASKIIAVTRKPEALADLAAKGVVVRAGDFDDEAGLVKAFSGAKRALIISTDAMDRPGHRLEQHLRAVAAAEKAGVAHVHYTSIADAERSLVSFAPDHLGTEKAIANSKIPGWTILRHNWYFDNLFFSLPQSLKSGSWYSAAADGKIAHMSRADYAKADAAALASNDTGKSIVTLSGTKAYTTDEIAALVRSATKLPLSVIHVPVEGLIQGMVAAGLPEPMAQTFASFDANTAGGYLAGVTGAYQKLTGKPPQPFESWLQANAAALQG